VSFRFPKRSSSTEVLLLRIALLFSLHSCCEQVYRVDGWLSSYFLVTDIFPQWAAAPLLCWARLSFSDRSPQASPFLPFVPY